MDALTRLKNPDITLRIIPHAPGHPERIAEALLICRYAHIYARAGDDTLLFTLPGRGARYRVVYHPFMRGIKSFETAYEFPIQDTLLPLAAFTLETFEAALLALQWQVLALAPERCEESQVHYRFIAEQMGIRLPETRVLTIYAECGEG